MPVKRKKIVPDGKTSEKNIVKILKKVQQEPILDRQQNMIGMKKLKRHLLNVKIKYEI